MFNKCTLSDDQIKAFEFFDCEHFSLFRQLSNPTDPATHAHYIVCIRDGKVATPPSMREEG